VFKVQTLLPYVASIIGALYFSISYNDKHRLRLILSSAIATFIACFPIIFFTLNNWHDYPHNDGTMVASFPIYAYVIHCFHQSFHQDKPQRFSYYSLFLSVWQTLFVIIIALIFSAVAYYILYLAAWSFKVLGYNFLINLFGSNLLIIINSLFFFCGVGIAKQFPKLIYNMQFVLFKMFQYLFPFFGILLFCFFILFLINNSISDFGNATLKGQGLLLVFSILGVIFFNAYFQSGEKKENNAQKILSKSFRVLLFFVTFIICAQGFSQFSLSLNLHLYFLLLFLFAFTYALAIFFIQETENKIIQYGNIAITLFYLLATVIINNPFYSFNTNRLQSVFSPSPLKKHKTTIDSLTPKKTPLVLIDPNTNLTLTQPNIQIAVGKIDKVLALKGLIWRPSNTTITYAISASLNPSILEGICRTIYQDGYQIGRWSHNQCWISYAGRAFTVNQFEVLTGQNALLKWGETNSPYLDALPLGIEWINPAIKQTTRILYACRTLQGNEVVLGKQVDNNCNIAMTNKEKSKTAYQLLLKK
jgi:MFS family permease